MGDDNPNMVRVGDPLEKEIRRLTYLVPNHELDPSDVFIVGYMKSGTTWFRNLAAGIVYGLNSEYVPYAVVWELIPNHGPKKPFYKRYQTPMYFKVHDFPRPQYKRVVFLVRDGRDVVVSLAHHLRNVYKNDVDMLALVQGRSPQFDVDYPWCKHAEAWLANPYRAEILTIRFEDLKKDPLPELRRFCEFTGLKRDEGQLEKAVAYASFEAMREKEARLGMDYHTWPKDRPFVRRGEVGSHKDELTPEALAAFMRDGGEALLKFGYL